MFQVSGVCLQVKMLFFIS